MSKMSRGAVVAIASVSSLAVMAGGGTVAAVALATDSVTVTTDGKATSYETREKTVDAFLKKEGIAVGSHDVVQPGLNTQISDGSAINIQVGKPITMTVDGKKVTKWTTASNLRDALTQFGLDDPQTVLSTSRSAALTRQGLSVDLITPKTVTVKSKDGSRQIKVAGNSTVADALKAAGLQPDGDDRVSAAASSTLAPGQVITFQQVTTSTSTKKVAVDFSTTEKKTSDLDKGDTKVKSEGTKGEKQVTTTTITVDGKVVSSKPTSEKMLKAPVNKVVLVGTHEKPAPSTSSSSSSSSSSKSNTQSSSSSATVDSSGISGTCGASFYDEDEMTASGESFNTNDLTAAHKTLPFGTRLRVTNVANGKSVVVRINDRGPYIGGRCLDLSTAAMSAVGGISSGVITVSYQQVK